MARVSVIVPVYNSEEYLEECLDSLIGQTFKDFEIICVLDGPTDQSGSIARRYAQNDSRIVVIEQPNSGQSMARNVGLRRATGEYLLFVDSDDWVAPEFVEKLYCSAVSTGSGMVICNYSYYRNHLVPEQPLTAGVYDAGEICRQLIIDKSFRNFVGNKLFNKEILKKYQISFPIGMSYEDIAILPRVAYLSQKVAVIDEYLYYYRIRPNSVTSTYNRKNFLDLFKALEMIKLFLQESDLYELYQAEFDQCCLGKLIDSATTICRKSPQLIGLIDELEAQYFNLIDHRKRLLPRTKDLLSTHSRLAYRLLLFNRRLFTMFASRKWI